LKEKRSAGTYLDIFLTFAKIGAFTFGGGYAMLPLIHSEVVEKKGWLSDSDMLDILAISESTPGPFAINCATFTGYRCAGVLGSAMATLGVTLPSFTIIVLVSLALSFFQDNRWVSAAFRGIRAGVAVLILNAGIRLAKKLKWGVVPLILAAAAFLISSFTNLSVIWVLAASALLGILFVLISGAAQNKGGR
jgi:chromate transporter